MRKTKRAIKNGYRASAVANLEKYIGRMRNQCRSDHTVSGIRVNHTEHGNKTILHGKKFSKYATAHVKWPALVRSNMQIGWGYGNEFVIRSRCGRYMAILKLFIL